MLLQVAMWDLCPNIYAKFATDVLHQDYNGMSRYLLEALYRYVVHNTNGATWSTINDRLMSMAHMHKGSGMPASGLLAPKTTAYETRAIFQYLPVALEGLLPETVVALFAGKQLCI